MREAKEKSLRLVLLAVAIAVVGAVSAWWWSHGAAAVAPTVEVKTAAGQASQQPKAPVGDLSPGTALPTGPVRLDGQYTATYSVRYSAPGVDGNETTATLAVRGTLRAQLRSAAAPSRWLALRLDPDTVAGNTAMAAATGLDDTSLRSRIADAFVVSLDSDGRMGEVRFAAATPAPVQALLAGVAYAAQFVRAADAPPSKWQAQEQDVQGAYAADYASQGHGAYQKSWQVGDAAHPAAAGDASGRVQTNRVQLQVVDHRIAALQCSQQGSLDLGALGAERSAAHFTLALALRRTGDGDGQWAAHVDPASLLRFDPAAAPPAATAQRAARPVAELVRALQSAGPTPAPAVRATLRSEIIEALVARPAAAAEVDAALRADDLSEPAERTLLEALAGSGVAPAQAVLVGLAVDRAIAEALRDRAILAATQATAPGPQFTSALLAAVDAQQGPVAGSTYAVAVGAAVQRLSRTDPGRAQALGAELVRRAGGVLGGAERPVAGAQSPTAPTLGDQRNWLAALGNSGDPAALPVLLQHLASPKEALRLAAAHALRFQNPQDCKEQMAYALSNDESADVRAALMHAARYMGPAQLATLVEKALRFDKAELVRIEAAYTVASWSATAPGLRKMLAAALAAEKSAKVQKAIENLLAPAKPASDNGSGAGK